MRSSSSDGVRRGCIWALTSCLSLWVLASILSPPLLLGAGTLSNTHLAPCLAADSTSPTQRVSLGDWDCPLTLPGLPASRMLSLVSQRRGWPGPCPATWAESRA